MINSNTSLNMVIGYPLEHTQSPILHNTVYQMMDCNAVMLAVSNHDLLALTQAIKALSVGLVAVTMPFKEKILSYLDEASVEVKTLKAANTVICKQGKLYGYNTDIDGIKYALRARTLSNKNILIIGAGGAARALAYVLHQELANLLWLNRTYSRACNMATLFGGNSINADEIDNIPVDIIINTTPLGMFPDISHTPLADYQFNANQIVFDMVYNPVDTLLLKRAKAHGAECISGLDMFIGQGLRQIELWLNQPIMHSILIEPIKTQLQILQMKSEGIL